jgi:hypothetical protein
MAMRRSFPARTHSAPMRSRSGVGVMDCVGGEAGMQRSVGLRVIANNLTATTNN